MRGLIRWLVLTGLMVLGMQKPVAAEGELQVALKRALQEHKITGGTALHIGASTPTLAEGLYKQGHFLVQIVVGSNETRDNVRAELIEKGLQGPVSAYRHRGNKLPHNSNLAALLVVENTLEFDEAELDRVLAPGGVLLRRADGGWSTHVKAFPPSMDDWRHIDYDGGRSRTARDVTVGYPSGLRWIASSDMWGIEKPEQTTSLMLAAEGKLVTVRPAQDRASVWISAHCAWSGVLLWTTQYETPSYGRFEVYKGRCPGVIAASKVWVRERAIDLDTGRVCFSFDGLPQMAWSNTVVCLTGFPGRKMGTWIRESAAHLPTNAVAYDAESGTPRWTCAASAAAGVADAVYTLVAAEKGMALEARHPVTGRVRWRQAPVSGDVGDRPSLTPRAFQLSCSKRFVLVTPDVYRSSARGGPQTVWVYSAEDGAFLRAIRFTPPKRSLNLVTRCLDADDVLWFWTGMDGEITLYSPDSGTRLHKSDTLPSKTTGRLVGISLSEGKVVHSHVLRLGKAGVRCGPFVMSGRYVIFGDNAFIHVDDGTSGNQAAFRLGCGISYVSAYDGLYVPPSANCGCINRLHGVMAYEMEGGLREPGAPSRREYLEKGAAYGDASLSSTAGAELKRDPTLSELVLKTIRKATAGKAGAHALPKAKTLEDGTVQGVKERIAPDRPAWQCQKTPVVVPWVVGDGRVVAVLPNEHRLAMLGDTGKKLLWAFTADARLGSAPQPHLIGDLCVFGGRDGWVYAVRAADGALVWRNLAAPEDKRVVAYEQLESPWPVHLQMVVRDGRVYAACGTHFDTGVTVSCVELATGKALWKRCVSDPDDEKEQQLRGFRADGMRLDEATGSVATGFWLLDPVTGEVTTLLEKAGAKPNTKEWWRLFLKALGPIKQRGYRE